MIAMRWRLRRWASLLGWQGLVGLCLGSAALAVYLASVEPGRARIRQLHEEAVSVRQFGRAQADAASTAPESRGAWLQRFYSLLPTRESAPHWLGIVFSVARANALSLEQGEYKMKADRNGRLQSYEIGLPVRGTYVQIRSFVGDVLEQVPALALDEIVIKRGAISDARIDASIRFTLFLNAG